MTAAAAPFSGPSPTLADAVIPRTLVRDAALVVAFAALTATAAQLTIHLPWTPVPITGQTFAVLATGTALGWKRGALSQLLYVGVGALGAPIYAAHSGGWAAATGATGGYLVGFIVAAALVGALCERRQDRQLLTSLPAMLAGSAVVYAFGVPWLAHSLHVSGTKAVELGMAPFLIGDALKLVLAGAIAPVAWRFVERDTDR
jgi:biotin transport system substrate-specific component